MAVLLFCIAFGLSMDYEVFLIARIREYWCVLTRDMSAMAPAPRRAANDERASPAASPTPAA
ncbi:hypothetical protein A4G28_20505 [Mycobacterium ostraviense]|uniref:Membrane transport protein MMPL domain-containing protein n=1 Tax=Mycobacterium ostraviense TaxID=2738409 RepID=A0A162CWS5_9MYCO|nr:hypothetical protein A4G28_20505 [Mycobacterium ostraviense]